MKMILKLGMTLWASLMLVSLVSCNNSKSATTTTPDDVKNVTLDLIKDGKTEYTVVYDDKNSAATDLADSIQSAFAKKGVEIPVIAASAAEADYGKEIVVGNVRASADAVAAKMNPSADFAMCVNGDDWVLVATNEMHYDYLRMVAEEVLANILNGALSVESANDLVCSTSKYATIPYAEYLKKAYKRVQTLPQEYLDEIFEAKEFTASERRTKLPYQIYVPSNYDPAKQYPVVLFLHGAGERGNGNDNRTDRNNFVDNAYVGVISVCLHIVILPDDMV